MEAFHNDPRHSDGKQSHCKQCKKLATRAYYRSPEGKQHQRQYEQLPHNKERVRKYGLRRYHGNELTRTMTLASCYRQRNLPTPAAQRCEHCGSENRITGHHASYRFEHWLTVAWLCEPCHKAEHIRIRDAGEEQALYHSAKGQLVVYRQDARARRYERRKWGYRPNDKQRSLL